MHKSRIVARSYRLHISEPPMCFKHPQTPPPARIKKQADQLVNCLVVTGQESVECCHRRFRRPGPYPAPICHHHLADRIGWLETPGLEQCPEIPGRGRPHLRLDHAPGGSFSRSGRSSGTRSGCWSTCQITRRQMSAPGTAHSRLSSRAVQPSLARSCYFVGSSTACPQATVPVSARSTSREG